MRQKYVVSAAFDLAVASHADADRLLRTEPQVRLTNLHFLSMQSVSNHHANNFGARIDTIPNASALGLARTPTGVAFRNVSGIFRRFSVELSASFWLLYSVCSYQRTAFESLRCAEWTFDGPEI